VTARLRPVLVAPGRTLLVFDQMPASDRLEEWTALRERLEASPEIVGVLRFDYRVDVTTRTS